MARPLRGPIRPTFGEETLRHRTNVRGQSLRAAAGELGMGYHTLFAVEQSERVPDLYTFAKIIRWRGIDPAQGLKELGI